MSQPNRKYKRLEALLSESKPVDPNPASRLVHDEVDAMKARISELETRLALQSDLETVEEKTDNKKAPENANLEKNFSNPLAQESSSTRNDKQKRNALQTLRLLVGAIVISLPIYLYWVFQTGAWQIYAIIACLVIAGVSVGFGISLVRRNHVDQAMALMIVNAYFLIPIIVAVISGLGLVLATTQFLLVLAIVGQTFSGKRAIRFLLVGVAFSIVTFLIDFIAPWTRLSVPAIQFAVPIIAALLIGLLGFVVARQFNTYSLRTKLVVTFVAITLVSIGVVGFVTNRVATAQFNETLGSNFNQLALRMARETGDSVVRSKIALDALVLNKFIQESVDEANLNGTSSLTALANLDRQWAAASDNNRLIKQVLNNELAGELRELQARLPQYAELFITDRYGAIIASTNRTSDYYQADEEWWQGAWNNSDGSVYISQPTFDESSGVSAINIAIPIPAHNRSGFVGVLRATVNINELTNVLPVTLFGQTEQAVLVLPNNQFLSSEVGVDLGTLSPETIAGVSSLDSIYGQFEYEGVPSLVSKAPVTSANGQDQEAIENLHWTIVVYQDLAEAHEPITATTRGILLTAIGVLIIAGILALFVGGQFARPIEDLTAVAAQIATGNLSVKASEKSQDEIGTLAITFNRMTSQLQETLTNLEQRISDRTHDLELASEVGQSITEKISNLSELLSQSAELIRSKFSFYYTQIYIVDPSGRNLILRAGTGTAGAELMKRAHRLPISSTSLNGRAALDRQAVIVADTQQSSNFLSNPLLPLTRSELAIPLIANNRVVGVLDMQNEKPETFSKANLPAFQVLAGQLAIAIQNAALSKQAEEARLGVEAQSRRLTSSGWQEFMNAIDRNESIGYVFNQDEVIPLLEAQGPAFDNTLKIPIEITGANVGEVQLADDANRKWTEAETEIVRATVSRVGQHIENLRLLAQADRYRAEAELVSRRLTGEGWQTYLQTRSNLASGYSYNLNEIKPLDNAVESDASLTQTRPITVRNETIGELLINTDNVDLDDVNEIFSAVATQLGDHIENLRLIEETQQRTLDLEESQTFLDSVVENLPTMLFVKDAEELRFVRWNKAAEELTGFGRESLINKNDYDFFPKEQADSFTSDDRQVLVSGQTLDVHEESLATVHQGIRYMHTRKVPIYGKDGKAKYLLGVSEDVTERKHDQEILAQRANQLETVATVSSTASTVLDPDKLLQAVVDLTKERFNMYHTHIYLANESWNTLLLAAGAGEVGRQMVETGLTIEMDTQKSLVARAYREGKSVIVNDVHSEAGFLPNPMLPETRAEIAVPMIVGGKVLGVFDVQSEIAGHFTEADANIYTTLASQVAVALQNARLYVEQAATVTQLRELDRLKSSFLANMSHELRTPLNSILGFADVMLEELDGPLTENMNTDLGLIQKNGQHLLHLINDVLDMAKIESGTMNLNVEKFILHDVIDEVTSITSSLASEKSLSLFIEPDSDRDIEINADKVRLRQVMINLVNNAMKFTEKGKISIRALRENNDVLITVKDMGIGIPPEQLESVFQEFTQVDTTTTRKAGGTGLGLPISRRLIQMHSGLLWAESTGVDGEGTTFYVQLPIEANINEDLSLAVK